jgi:hypothetical protein
LWVLFFSTYHYVEGTILDDDIIDQQEEIDTETVKKDDFAAVPIHFRPGDGKVKLFKLVIPGIEPPLKKFKLTGDTPETLELIEVTDDDDVDDDTPEGDEVVNDEDAESPSEEAPSEATDDETVDEPAEIQDEELEGDIDYPYEDSEGNPIAGLLIAEDENAEPQVITVRPQEGESPEDAVQRVLADNNGYKVATLDEAIALIGHNPLTGKDN